MSTYHTCYHHHHHRHHHHTGMDRTLAVVEVHHLSAWPLWSLPRQPPPYVGRRPLSSIRKNCASLPRGFHLLPALPAASLIMPTIVAFCCAHCVEIQILRFTPTVHTYLAQVPAAPCCAMKDEGCINNACAKKDCGPCASPAGTCN